MAENHKLLTSFYYHELITRKTLELTDLSYVARNILFKILKLNIKKLQFDQKKYIENFFQAKV